VAMERRERHEREAADMVEATREHEATAKAAREDEETLRQMREARLGFVETGYDEELELGSNCDSEENFVVPLEKEVVHVSDSTDDECEHWEVRFALISFAWAPLLLVVGSKFAFVGFGFDLNFLFVPQRLWFLEWLRDCCLGCSHSLGRDCDLGCNHSQGSDCALAAVTALAVTAALALPFAICHLPFAASRAISCCYHIDVGAQLFWYHAGTGCFSRAGSFQRANSR
jgi:hypothetical protein